MRRRLLLGKKFDPLNGHEYVDLGLASGNLWAKYNVGSTAETLGGSYHSYGSKYNYSYSSKRAYMGSGELPFSCDTANLIMGGRWAMPSEEQFSELISSTTSAITTINSVKGLKLTSKKYTSRYLFFPYDGWYTSSGTFTRNSEHRMEKNS